MDHHRAQSIKLADQYLEAAKLCLELRLANPAISMAVHSAIHAKDAVYLKETEAIPKPRSHAQASGDLRSLGVLKESAIRQFARLIASKSEAEYGQEHQDITNARAEWNSRATGFGELKEKIGGWIPAPYLASIILPLKWKTFH